MGEFEAEWERVTAEAERRARADGRGDVAAYLALRKANDAVRAIGIEWLIGSFTALAGELNRGGGSIEVKRKENHRFRAGNSTMVGTLLTLRSGQVHALTIEAGWPRAPRDGILRGGGLASAHIKHFGHHLVEELLLVKISDSVAPDWLVYEASGTRTLLREERLRQHLLKLCG